MEFLSFEDKVDGYKVGHPDMMVPGTTAQFSYFESRPGALWPYTVWFGLQFKIMENLLGKQITYENVQAEKTLSADYFGDPYVFPEEKWLHVVEDHSGRIPLEIRSVPEGTAVPIGNALMTVVSTCDKCAWMTSMVETMLTPVWYSSNVATLSRTLRTYMEGVIKETGTDPTHIDFMLHDFGYRGATGNEAAGIGGLAHLISFMGTDTKPALRYAQRYYGAVGAVGYSIKATEHSVMTAEGAENDLRILDRLLAENPTGPFACVGDSNDIFEFTEGVVDRREVILNRPGKFVLRPDSVTKLFPSPHELVLELLEMLWNGYGDVGTITSTGHRQLPPQIGLIWGDGIGPDGIKKILDLMDLNMFAAGNIVFGMGGGLLQKHDRDTQRNAFKCSAQERDGEWVGVSKNTYGKKSKAGRLALIVNAQGNFETIVIDDDFNQEDNKLEVVFLNGELVKEYTFDEVRKNTLDSVAAL